MKVAREAFGSYKKVLYSAAYMWLLIMVLVAIVDWHAAFGVLVGGLLGMLMMAAYRLGVETGEIEGPKRSIYEAYARAEEIDE